MVLAERNSELVRNGRSRGPSPNGHGASSGGGNNNSSGVGGGAGTPETSSDDDNSIKRNGKSKNKQSEYEEKIRVGRDYQAVCPSLIPEVERKPEVLNDRALLVWSPTKDIPDTKLEEYISVAKEKYGYNGEQALGMLFWHKHDLERAVMDLANFTPFPDEWTFEDKVLFEQAFQFHGKSFHRIRQMMPDKSIASLVKYYYSWKKTRHRQSVMDRQEKAKASKEGSENGSDNGSNEESDNDDKDQTMSSAAGFQEQQNNSNAKFGQGDKSLSSVSSKSAINDLNANNTEVVDSNSQPNESGIAAISFKQRHQTPPNSNTDSSCTGRTTPSSNSITGTLAAGGCCTNCGVPCNLLNASPHGKLCSSCHHHWRRTGNKRPTSGPYFGKRIRDRNAERHKRKPPRGMNINHDDIVALASDNQDEFSANTDREKVSLLSQAQQNKQNISSVIHKNSEQLDEPRTNENANRINARWTSDELLLAVEAIRKYGKDYQTIADTLGTKTEAHVRTFFVSHRRRYNLDQLVKKHEAEKEAAAVTPGTSLELSSIKDDTKAKKDSTNSVANVVDESDNTTSSETNASKYTSFTTTTTNTNDDTKQSLIKTNQVTAKEDLIMEIDLDSDQLEAQPAAKKIALSVTNQDFPKASAV